MSEKYWTGLETSKGKINRAEEGQMVHWTELDDWIWRVALLERLERLVAVLGQIRDRLPGQIAK